MAGEVGEEKDFANMEWRKIILHKHGHRVGQQMLFPARIFINYDCYDCWKVFYEPVLTAKLGTRKSSKVCVCV